jgi:hypothetical protein
MRNFDFELSIFLSVCSYDTSWAPYILFKFPFTDSPYHPIQTMEFIISISIELDSLNKHRPVPAL